MEEEDPRVVEIDGVELHLEPIEDEQHTGLPPRLESWRRRSAMGAIMSGIALGLKEALEPEKDEPAIVVQVSGEPIGERPVEAQLDERAPKDSVVTIRPWLLPEGEDALPSATGALAAPVGALPAWPAPPPPPAPRPARIEPLVLPEPPAAPTPPPTPPSPGPTRPSPSPTPPSPTSPSPSSTRPAPVVAEPPASVPPFRQDPDRAVSPPTGSIARTSANRPIPRSRPVAKPPQAEPDAPRRRIAPPKPVDPSAEAVAESSPAPDEPDPVAETRPAWVPRALRNR